jgi:EmrB/QacA subfamily drug resistance transporter
VLDMNIVATALPTIASKLGDLELFGWVGAAYLLTTAAVTPFYGKLGDLFGRKRVFMAAIALFVLGSLACGLAWSMQSLIAARVLQALGGGGLMTSAFAIMADLFEPRERARYQGYSSAVFTLGGIIGPVAGGLISQTIGWQYIFLLNLPVGIAVIAIVALGMPNTAPTRSHKIDYLGGLLLAAAVTLTVFWAEEAAGGGYGGAMIYVLPVIAIATIGAFILVERRATEPVLPLKLFRDSTISLVLTVSVISGVVTLGMLNYFALFLQTVTGLPPAQAGLLFLPSAFGSLLSSIAAGNIIARTGRYKYFPVAAMALGVVVMWCFTLVRPDTPIWVTGITIFFFSVALGLQMQTLMVAVQAAAPREDVGAATGAIALARMVGASLGLALNGGLLTAGLVRGQALLAPEVAAALPAPVAELTPAAIQALPPEVGAVVLTTFNTAFSTIFYVAMALFGVGFVLTMLLKDIRLPVTSKGKAEVVQPEPRGEPVAMHE